MDRGNADLSALSADFSVLGIDLWNQMHKSFPRMTPKWQATLTALNYVRNGVTHSDAEKLAAAHQDYGLTLATFRKWRSSVNGAVHAMEAVVGAYLFGLTGNRSW